MKKKIAMISMAVLLLAACASNNGADQQKKHENQNREAADSVFKQNCASCHGNNLEGATGPSLKHIGSKYSEKEIMSIILEGRKGMPAGILTGGDARLVAEWLKEEHK
ncbi:cytochrome c551 [Fictibacillus terranigra]|uniref:Cytochrome c n=1 Tax=Fictibacillus terranigra TaxID=3058424 RepID=A0ABT8E2H0_9BACL|nr:cytochrome c [Fictibacillus sp. CENA-BCM004]MDN4072087.1 cytochrome c [Fictibacillus sp. CENA-BCM004]